MKGERFKVKRERGITSVASKSPLLAKASVSALSEGGFRGLVNLRFERSE